jgi:hypothetical protein
MNYKIETAGEALAYFIGDKILTRDPWDKIATSLLYTGRSEGLCEFFHEITVINLTCRIVAAGTSLLKELGGRPARSPIDTSFQMDLSNFIRERLYIRPPLSNGLFRNALRAVEAAQRDVSRRERNALKQWAQLRHVFCYMCGEILDFSELHEHRRFTVDHIWPQRYGGDSIPENLLPSCLSCNSGKKRDFATWAMPSIQSVVLGFSPSASEYTMIDGTHRFAMHQLVARKVAIERKINLKRAFQILGPWEPTPRLVDEDDIGDFFNLANHRPSLDVE